MEIEIQHIEQLGGHDHIDYSKLKVRKVNRTRLIFGNATHYFPVDNNVKVQILAFIKQGGEYRQMPYKIPEKNLCDFYNEDQYFYPQFAAATDYPLPYPCPLPPVNIYTLEKTHFTFKLFQRVFMAFTGTACLSEIFRWLR